MNLKASFDKGAAGAQAVKKEIAGLLAPIEVWLTPRGRKPRGRFQFGYNAALATASAVLHASGAPIH